LLAILIKMDALYIFLLSLFLVWMFFLTVTMHSLTKLGEAIVQERLPTLKGRFFYYPLYITFSSKARFDLLIFSTRVGANISRFAFAGLLLFWLAPLTALSSNYLILILAILFVTVLLIGDFFPRYWVSKSPLSGLKGSLFFSSFFLYLSYPFSVLFILLLSKSLYRRYRAKEENPIEETQKTILHILQSSTNKESLDAIDKKLIESVVKFKDRIVREVMVPRIDLFSLPTETTLRAAAPKLIEEGYSRIPVYRESIDNIIGILMFKDVTQVYMDVVEGRRNASILDTSIEPLIKSVCYAPETKRVSQLLQEFRTQQKHMAIVVDEYGGTEGVVTIEDILEEIVGEIADEYDFDEETLYIPMTDGDGWIVDARMSLFDAEDIFGIQIPQEGDYDTIGGYVFHKAGSIPPQGFKIHHEKFDLEILNSSERSVEKVRVTLRRSESE
ncbi:MAG: hemolysin family protein, partial [Chlamydiales bacterium]